jgi:hypothetical protein
MRLKPFGATTREPGTPECAFARVGDPDHDDGGGFSTLATSQPVCSRAMISPPAKPGIATAQHEPLDAEVDLVRSLDEAFVGLWLVQPDGPDPRLFAAAHIRRDRWWTWQESALADEQFPALPRGRLQDLRNYVSDRDGGALVLAQESRRAFETLLSRKHAAHSLGDQVVHHRRGVASIT